MAHKTREMNGDDARAVEDFLAAIRAERGAAANTIAAYRRDLVASAGDMKGGLLKADSDAIRECLAVWANNLAARSVARRLTALSGFMQFCVAEGLRESDPTAGIDRPKLPRPLPKSLTEDDVARLFAAANGIADESAGGSAEGTPGAGGTMNGKRLVAMLEILYATGLRISEMVSLPLAAVARGQKTITITGKGGKERVVMMTDAAIASVMDWLSWRDKDESAVTSDYLFPSGDKHVSRGQVWREISGLAARAGIGTAVSPHMLRHSFATHMLNRGADLRSLQLLLGHANITTTEIYTQTQDKRLAGLVRDTHPLGRDRNGGGGD